MDQGVSPIQERQRCLVAIHEELLYVYLAEGKQRACPALVLNLEYFDTMCFRKVPRPFIGENNLSYRLCKYIKEEIEGPVEHLDEEREFL